MRRRRPRAGGSGRLSAVAQLLCGVCNAPLAATQEYCLACGARRRGHGRLGPLPARRGRGLAVTALFGIVAAAGAAGAIALTTEASESLVVITALGGSVEAPTGSSADPRTLATWPKRNGWTIVLLSVPKVEGRDPALAIVERARQRKLEQVGILDSGRFASTHPGFWLAVTGVYETEPEATGALRRARAVSKSARVQRIAR